MELEAKCQFAAAPDDVAYAAMPDDPRMRAAGTDFVHQQGRDFFQAPQCFRAG